MPTHCSFKAAKRKNIVICSSLSVKADKAFFGGGDMTLFFCLVRKLLKSDVIPRRNFVGIEQEVFQNVYCSKRKHPF